MKNQTLTIFFKIVPFIEANVYKYIIHIFSIMGFAVLIGAYSFIYLNKYEKDSKNLLEKKYNLGKRLNDLFNQKREEGYTVKLINATKKALNLQQKQGKFVDMDKEENEIYEELEMYVVKQLERLKMDAEEEQKQQQIQREMYMEKIKKTWRVSQVGKGLLLAHGSSEFRNLINPPKKDSINFDDFVDSLDSSEDKESSSDYDSDF